MYSGGIELKKLSMNFGVVSAVQDVDLVLPDGKFVCLLGPSGSGKTTLLRLIAGLQKPSRGDIIFDGRSIVDVPSHRRDFGMVFQSLALFPQLNVAQNVSYALRIRGQSRAQIDTRVASLLDMVQLSGLDQRRITQLSGGQRQRVAIARALAIEPKLFLLDEPLSALDAKLRETMQVELRQLQKKLGITTIVVTHDQREAMTMADIVVIMKDGKIQQHGAPLDIYRNPATAFVADFIGSSNLLACTLLDNRSVDIDGQRFAVANIAEPLSDGDDAVLSIRPEDVLVLPQRSNNDNQLIATITFIRDLGSHVEIMLVQNDHELLATMAPRDKPKVAVGDSVAIELCAHSCRVVAP